LARNGIKIKVVPQHAKQAVSDCGGIDLPTYITLGAGRSAPRLSHSTQGKRNGKPLVLGQKNR